MCSSKCVKAHTSSNQSRESTVPLRHLHLPTSRQPYFTFSRAGLRSYNENEVVFADVW